MLITQQQLLSATGGQSPTETAFYINAMDAAFQKWEINTQLRIAHFLAQVLHESGNLKAKEENLNYTESGLVGTFGKYFSLSGTDGKLKAVDYARKPEKIANVVYANRMGNGNSESGDGWKYRGRGLIQITGKNNYDKFSRDSGINISTNPDLMNTSANVICEVACWYWRKGNGDLNVYADKDDINEITKRINGGLNGLDDRKKKLTLCKTIFR